MINKPIFNVAIGPVEQSYSWYLKISPCVSTLLKGRESNSIILSAEDIFSSKIRFAIKFSKEDIVEHNTDKQSAVSDEKSWTVSVSAIIEKKVGEVFVVDRIIPGLFSGSYHEYPLVNRTFLEIKGLFESSLLSSFDIERKKILNAVNLMDNGSNIGAPDEMVDTALSQPGSGLVQNLSLVVDNYRNKLLSPSTRYSALTVLSIGALFCAFSFFYFNSNASPAVASELSVTAEGHSLINPNENLLVKQERSITSSGTLSEFMASGTNDPVHSSPQTSDTQQVALVKETLQSMGFDLSKTTDTGCLVN